MSTGNGFLDTLRATQDHLETRPKGTVIQITDTAGHRFWLLAEGATWRDFIHHQGDVPYVLRGRTSKAGQARTFWSSAMLARWVAEGICRIEDSK